LKQIFYDAEFYEKLLNFIHFVDLKIIDFIHVELNEKLMKNFIIYAIIQINKKRMRDINGYVIDKLKKKTIQKERAN
jgi:hypothetical protein